jgi:hypothetical protein
MLRLYFHIYDHYFTLIWTFWMLYRVEKLFNKGVLAWWLTDLVLSEVRSRLYCKSLSLFLILYWLSTTNGWLVSLLHLVVRRFLSLKQLFRWCNDLTIGGTSIFLLDWIFQYLTVDIMMEAFFTALRSVALLSNFSF